MVRTPNAFVKKSARTLPPKPPMSTTYITPIATPRPRIRYGHTACSTGVTIANAQAVSTDCGMPQITNHATLCVETCSGVKNADGRMSAPTSTSAFDGILAIRAVEVAADRIEERHRGPAREAEDEAAVQDVGDVQRVVQVEHLQRAEREHAEAERGERGDRGADRRDLLQPGERGFHRRLGRVLVLDDLAEHVLLLVLAARRLLQQEHRTGRGSRPVSRARRTPSASPRRRPPRLRSRRR